MTSQPINRPVVFGIIAMTLMMMTIDSTIVSTALDTLQRELDTTITWVGWTVTAYMFGFILMLPVAGRWSERYGRRRVFLGSMAMFTFASLLCGLTSNIYVLIALRALQAMGGAGFTPSATGIVVDYFGDARDRAVSLFGSIIPIGAMIGPVFGGFFVTYMTWRWVFLINVPVGLIVLALTLKFIPKDPARIKQADQRMDPMGMLLLSLGLLAAMFAITYIEGGNLRASWWKIGVPLVIAVLSMRAFFVHIGRRQDPFISPTLMIGKDFGAVNLYNGLYGGVTIGVITLIPYYASHRYGLSPLASGVLLTVEGIAVILTTFAAVFALRRTGHRPPLYVGSTLIIASLLLLWWGPQGNIAANHWLMMTMSILGVGFGVTNPASRNAGLQLAPEHSSTLAALRTMTLNLGTILTVSISTAVMANAHDPGHAQAAFYLAIAALLAVGLPVISRIPEHRGAW